MIPEWVGKYIGIPFNEHGMDEGGVSCYGLVCLVYRNELGLTLKTYDHAYDTIKQDRENICAAFNTARNGAWKHIDQYTPWCVGLFRIYGKPLHIGIMVNADEMLNVRDGVETSIERVDSMTWNTRLVGLYEYAHAD